MKNKLKFLTKISLNKKIQSRWFVIANVIILVAIVCLVNADSLVKLFGGDFDDTTDILVIDNTEEQVFDEFKATYEQAGSYLEDSAKTDITLYEDSIEEAKEEVKEEDKVLLVLEDDDTNFLKASLISSSGVDVLISQIITSSINSVKSNLALNYYNITPDKLAIIDKSVEIESIKLDDSQSNDEMMELLMGVAFPIIILPFFMLTLFLVQMIGAEINEEKTTRGMEIIISNVSPKVHFFSKLLASNIFVILQGVLLIIDVIIAVIVRMATTGVSDLSSMVEIAGVGDMITALTTSGILNNLIYIIPLTLILMLLTLVAYSLVAGILASMTTNIEDYQQVQTPIVIISLIGYYLAMMAVMFDGSLFIRILSYVPFISALLAPALLILGQISIIDVIIAIVILIISIALLFKYGLRIYKVGILNYSSNGLWKKMFKAVRSR